MKGVYRFHHKHLKKSLYEVPILVLGLIFIEIHRGNLFNMVKVRLLV